MDSPPLAPARLCVSADSHVVEPPELFAPLVKRFGDRAPRVVETDDQGPRLRLADGTLGIPIGGFLISGENVKSPEAEALKRQGYAIARPGVYDVRARVADQDRDGVAAEVIYPSVLFNVYQVADTEVLCATFAAYNDWLASYVSQARSRLFGLGAIQLRDIGAAIAEMRRVKNAGFVGVNIPASAPADRPYSDPSYDPFWAAAEDMEMPLAMHVFSGATANHGMPPFKGLDYTLSHLGIQVTIGTLIMSGVCERFPRLRFVPTEFGTGWVADFLQRIDWTWVRSGGGTFPGVKLPMTPSQYWKRNFLITFEDDEIGIRTRDVIGVQNLMWGNDYPHGDSTFPGSQGILDELFAGQEHDRLAITAVNACELYRLPLAASAAEAARVR